MLVGSCSMVEEGADMIEGVELAADDVFVLADGRAGPITCKQL